MTTESNRETTSVGESDGLPVRWRELFAVLALVVLCDITLYRGHGPAGHAVLLILAPWLFLLGSPRPRCRTSLWVVSLMLVVLAAKLLWCGYPLLLPVGLALLVAWAMSLSGQVPHVLETLVFTSQTVSAGYRGLIDQGWFLVRVLPRSTRTHWLNMMLPLATASMFSLLFVLANPDLLATFSERLAEIFEWLRDGLIRISPEPLEVLFWLAVVWLGVGLLRPRSDRPLLAEIVGDPRLSSNTELPVRAALYPAFRNTLVVVLGLFAVYLVFEFKTLWFRRFPPGFHYSGYAHEGAAWLTVALALATAMLSLVFRGEVLRDARLPRLKRLAWLWSLENLLLAIAVYHRLFIYIGFNGMTRMRIVGLYGMSAVVVGFLLVLRKIACHHDFVWLIRRHLWTLAVAVYLLAVTPLDMIVVSYDVHRILSGDPAPSVQLSVHPICSEGVLFLQPLLECRDPIIREGIRAMLAQRHEEAEQSARRRRQQGWTSHQIADQLLLVQLRAASGQWAPYADYGKRREALQRFHRYVYQWY